MRAVTTGLIAASVALAACSGGGSKSSSATVQSTAPPPASWQSQGLKVVSPPSGDGDTVAVVDGTAPDLVAVVLDAATGKERFRRPWSVAGEISGTGVGSPAVIGGVVVTDEAAGASTAIVAHDAHSGAEKWRQVVPTTFHPFKCGTLVCSEEGEQQTGMLVARDPATGTTKWTSPGYQSYVVNDASTFVEQHLGATAALYSLDPATGATRWKVDERTVFGPTATTDQGWDAISRGGVVVGSINDGVVGVDAATGTVKWKRPKLTLCPVHSSKDVLLCGDTSGVRRIDPVTGADAWPARDIAFPTAPGPFFGLTADEGAIVGKDSAGHPIRVDAATGTTSVPTSGTLAWTFVGRPISVKPTPSDQATDFLGFSDLVPYDATGSGSAQVTSASQVPPLVGLTVSQRRVFVDDAGTVHALPA